MMKTIKITTLIYHDGPLLSEGRDPIGGHYLVMSVSDDAQGDRFVVAGIEPRQLRLFKNGSKDLLTALTDRVVSDWFIGRYTGDDGNVLVLEEQPGLLSESDFLPKPGFRLHPAPKNDAVLPKSKLTRKFVAPAGANPKK
ncbi:MAG: hypothetical protein ABJA67_07950 [Chthonomonadales bacterium]